MVDMCKKCNNMIRDPVAIKRGYGSRCWRKLAVEERNKISLEIREKKKNDPGA